MNSSVRCLDEKPLLISIVLGGICHNVCIYVYNIYIHIDYIYRESLVCVYIYIRMVHSNMVILMGSMMINLLNHWILGYYTAPLDQDMRRMEETHRFLVNDQ
jgi:hypothetical protein